MEYLVIKNRIAATHPDKTGEMAKDAKILPTPSQLRKGVKFIKNSLCFTALVILSIIIGKVLYLQSTASQPKHAIPMPIMAPIMECVVDTGMLNRVASNTQVADPTMAHIMPYISKSGRPLKSYSTVSM